MNTVATRLELVQSKTLTTLVQEEIVRMIRDGELLPGAKLVESNFTNMLGVNRAPVREAFRAVEEAGLVRLEKNKGVYVRNFSPDEAVELYEMRAWLEEMAGNKIFDTIMDGQIAELAEINSRLGRLAVENDINRYYPLNIEFHDRFVSLANHTSLLNTYRRITDQMHLLRRRGYEAGPGLVRSHDEHEAILSALSRRDKARLADAVRAHAENGMRRFLST